MIPPASAAAAHPVPWMVYASEGRLGAPRHIRWLGEQVMRLVRGDAKRLVVSCPPRHGKSVFLAQHLTSWWLGKFPEQRVIYVTMQERFSRSWGRKARDAFHAHAQGLWGVTTWSRASTAEWEVYRDGRPTGGSMTSVGAGGTITGKGAHLLVVDDLIRNLAEAQNATLRESQWEWFESACLTRLEPDARVVILMTRWHHDDLIGRLMKKQADGELGERWEFVNLPAVAEGDDPLGRAPGEALWPARYPVDALEKRRKDVGPYVWDSLYQGRPTPKGGNIIKSQWFRDFERHGHLVQVPGLGAAELASLYRFCTVDLAASEKKRADYTSIGTWGYLPRWHALLLLDVVHERLAPHLIVPTLQRVHEVDKPTVVYVEREGPRLKEKLGFSVVKEALSKGVPVVELTPDGDKVARAIAATGAFAAGQVFFRKGAPWRGELELELVTFPDAAHDDSVDMVTYGVGIYRELVEAQRARDRAAELRDYMPDDGGWDYGVRG